MLRSTISPISEAKEQQGQLGTIGITHREILRYRHTRTSHGENPYEKHLLYMITHNVEENHYLHYSEDVLLTMRLANSLRQASDMNKTILIVLVI